MEKRCCGCMKLKNQSPVCEHCGYDETTANASHQLPVGTVLNQNYRIGKVLGQGGFGITYLGWDQFLDIPVAVKEYYPGSMVMRECEYSLDVSCGGGEQAARFEKNRERFLREAKAIARLSDCPQIVKVSNYFQENNTAYIVMEFVAGTNLKEYVKRCGGTLSPEETFGLFRPVLDALDRVHKAGLVHRDISPDNIMLLPDGSVKLIDFGAVRDVQNAGTETPLTKSTEAILKQGYAPIEQYQKRGALGPWTDIYALCATIYYCLTGKVPMDAPERVLGEEEFSCRGIPGLTVWQAAALEKGMALLPKGRTQSAGELAKALFGEEEEPLPPPPPPPPPPAPPKPKKWWMAMLAVLLLTAVVIGIAGGIKSDDAVLQETQPQTRPVQTEITEAAVIAETTAVTEPAATTAVTESEDTRWESNILKKDNIGSGQTPVYGSRVRKSQIVSVTFYDDLSKASASAWDVSKAGDGSVMAWVSGNGQQYDLYLAAEGGINGIYGAESLFQDYINLKQIRFNGNLHTEQTESLHNMFAGCESLSQVDLSGFDTSNVQDMSGMFARCTSLTDLDLSSFDTTKVTSMRRLFYGCTGLRQLDISSFDTSAVVDMSEMFREISETFQPDISHFVFENVRANGQFMDEGRTVGDAPWQALFA